MGKLRKILNSKNFMKKYLLVCVIPYSILWITGLLLPGFQTFGQDPLMDFIHYLVVIPIWLFPLVFALWFLEKIKPKKIRG